MPINCGSMFCFLVSVAGSINTRVGCWLVLQSQTYVVELFCGSHDGAGYLRTLRMNMSE